MPPFQTETMSGKAIISAGYMGQPVVVVFATTPCPPCERALRAAEAVFHSYRDVVVLTFFQRDGAERPRSVAARLGLSYPAAVDQDGLITRRFQVTELPATFVIDDNGVIRWLGGPELTEASLTAAVEAVR